MGQWKWFFSLWNVRMPTCVAAGEAQRVGNAEAAATQSPTLGQPAPARPRGRRVASARLSEVSRVVLVEVDAVVVLPARQAAPSGVLAVLAHAPVAGAHVAALLAVVLQLRRGVRRRTRRAAHTPRPAALQAARRPAACARCPHAPVSPWLLTSKKELKQYFFKFCRNFFA